jgi:glycosyltransferase involved in cell wall biosynthesis
MNARTRVLLSAYGCEPGVGSEPGAGWEWCIAAAEHHDVWLLTRRNNVARIRAALATSTDLDVRIIGYDLPRPFPWLKKRVRGGAHIYYTAWQYAIIPVARRLHREVRFDLAHHITWSTDWLPVGVARLDDVPFVWGPIGGATRTPWRHWRWFGVRGVLTEAVRAIGIPLARRLFARRILRRASFVLAQNNDELRLVPRGTPVRVEPNVALRPATTRMRGALPIGNIAVFAGRALPWKGLRLAVATLSRGATDWHLHVYGDGPDLRSARRLAGSTGVEDRVHFHGRVGRDAVLAALSSADALLLPSFHEAAGWVVAEAMAAGCPVVCLDSGGPSVLVGDSEGVKIPTTERVLPAALACGLRSVASRGGMRLRDGRWSASRLPPLIRSIYSDVVRR